MRHLLSIVACLLVGCVLADCGTLQDAARRPIIRAEVRNDAACDHFSSAHRAWTGVATVAAFLSGGSGIATALPTDQTSRYAVGISSLVVGAVSALSSYLSSSYATDYVSHRCGVANMEPSGSPSSSGSP